MLSIFSKFFLAIMLAGCVIGPERREEVMKAEHLQNNIMVLEPQLIRFEKSGPFSVSLRPDREFNVDLDQTLVVDHFAAKSGDSLPIVVISHGNFSNKGAHRRQAKHLASWGFHVVTVESPNRDQWLENGTRLRKFLEMVHQWPRILGSNADKNRIIVVGHSFGGSAAILAIGSGAPVIGAVLLDPAVVHSSVTSAMKKSDVPVVLLGADRKIFTARGRSMFRKNIAGEMIEVTVPKAAHDDAQGPSVFAQAALGIDPFTSTTKQALFRSTLTAAVIGIATSGTLDFSTKIFERAAKDGVLKDLTYRDKI